MTVHPSEATNPDTSRYVELTRQRKARYAATNRRGGSIEVGEGDDAAFTPVELLLTALAACTAMDVDYIVGKRTEAESGWLSSSARKVRDDAGNHHVDLKVILDLRHPGARGVTLPAPPSRWRCSGPTIGSVRSAAQCRSAPRSWPPWRGDPSSPTTSMMAGSPCPPAPDERHCHPHPARRARCRRVMPVPCWKTLKTTREGTLTPDVGT